MRAHGKGSEGSEKRGGGAKIKRGCEKKGVHAAQAPPLCTPLIRGHTEVTLSINIKDRSMVVELPALLGNNDRQAD